jgi:hypothetical protein
MEHASQGTAGQTLQAISQDDGTVVIQVSHGLISLSAADAGALGEALQAHAADVAPPEPAAAEPAE